MNDDDDLQTRTHDDGLDVWRALLVALPVGLAFWLALLLTIARCGAGQ